MTIKTLTCHNVYNYGASLQAFALQEYLMQAMKDHSLIVTMEENVVTGGFGEQVACFLREQGYEGEVLPVAIPDAFVEHGNVNVLKQMLGMDAASVADRIIQQLS